MITERRSHLKLTLCGEEMSISERTKKTPSGGKVITLLSVPFLTSITCSTSPARVPNNPAFSTMNSCSFSVVQRSLHVAESESPVVTELLPITAMASMAFTIASRLTASFWVLRPRSWSEMRSIRFRLALCAAKSEHLVRKTRRTPSGGGGGDANSASAIICLVCVCVLKNRFDPFP